VKQQNTRQLDRAVRPAGLTALISLPFYDLFHENGHVPKIRKHLPPLLTDVRSKRS
jgi:hypothetical protein